MGFLRRVSGLSLRDRVRSSVIQEGLGVEPLLLRIERSQMRWFGHLVRMLPGRLPGEVFRARPTGRRPRGRPRTPERRLGTPRGPPGRAGGRGRGQGRLGFSVKAAAPATRPPEKRQMMDGWMDLWMDLYVNKYFCLQSPVSGTHTSISFPFTPEQLGNLSCFLFHSAVPPEHSFPLNIKV